MCSLAVELPALDIWNQILPAIIRYHWKNYKTNPISRSLMEDILNLGTSNIVPKLEWKFKIIRNSYPCLSQIWDTIQLTLEFPGFDYIILQYTLHWTWLCVVHSMALHIVVMHLLQSKESLSSVWNWCILWGREYSDHSYHHNGHLQDTYKFSLSPVSFRQVKQGSSQSLKHRCMILIKPSKHKTWGNGLQQRTFLNSAISSHCCWLKFWQIVVGHINQPSVIMYARINVRHLLRDLLIQSQEQS